MPAPLLEKIAFNCRSSTAWRVAEWQTAELFQVFSSFDYSCFWHSCLSEDSIFPSQMTPQNTSLLQCHAKLEPKRINENECRFHASVTKMRGNESIEYISVAWHSGWGPAGLSHKFDKCLLNLSQKRRVCATGLLHQWRHIRGHGDVYHGRLLQLPV